MHKKLGLAGIAIVIVVVTVGIYFWQTNGHILQTQDTSQSQEEAIKQAREYKPQGYCTQSLVPAIHKATGAKYTFSSGCLAPGWEPESAR